MPPSLSLLVTVALALAPAGAPRPITHPADALLQRTWTQEEGLPQNGVAAVTQTADGSLWVGTQEGLARFDGARWEVLDAARGLPCNDVLALWAEPGPGARLWVGTQGCGLVRYERGHFEHLPTVADADDDSVQAFLPAADGSGVWVGTDHGLAHVVGRSIRYVPGLGEYDVTSLAAGADGALWVGTRSGGVVRVTGAGAGARVVERLGAETGLGSLQVGALVEDARGVLWAGMRDGLYRRARGEARFTAVQELHGRKVSRLLLDRGGGLWVGTEDNGLLRERGGRFVPAGSESMRRMFVSGLFEDREGSVWVGTAPGGVHQLRESRVQMLGEPEGLLNDVVWSVFEDRTGAVWVGTQGAGLHRLRDGQLTRYGAAEGVPNGIVFGLSEDRAGGLWLATSAGAARFDGERFRRFTTRDGLPSDLVFAVHEDPAGDLWFGTDVALAKRDATSGRFTVYGAAEGISRNGVNLILDAPEGGLWLGMPAGLARFEGGRVVESFGRKQGLGAGSVAALVRDREQPGVLWLGGEGGLTRFEQGRARTLTVKDGLFDAHVLSVLDDGRGRLWMGSNHGIARVEKRALEDFFAGRTERVVSRVFGRADGLRAVECNSASRSASLLARDGSVWFPTISGAVRIDPARRARELPTPPLLIERVLSAGRPVSSAEGLSGETPDIELHYAALTFVDPERVRYRYQLEGYDPDWVEAGARREAFYTNLPPGQYRFRVRLERAAAAGAGTSGQPPVEASFTFRRHPRLLERPAVWGLGLVLLAGLAGLAYWLRVRRLRERERALAARVEERTAALARANRDLVRVVEESAEAEGSLRRLMDRLPIAVTVYVDHRAVYANDATLQLLGYTRFSELEGQTIDTYSSHEDAAVLGERLAQLSRGEATHAREVRLRRRDGTSVVVELSGVPLTFGGRAAIVAVARDVTQAQQMEARLRLSDRMASVGTLAAGVAHEINNPLAFVVSNLGFGAGELRAWVRALEAGAAPPLADVREVAQALDEAAHGASRVTHIVKELKTFSRGGDVPTRIDLRPVLESSLSMASNEVRHRARLRKALGPVPSVMASEAKLGQVFLNLVVNAAQAIREGAADQNEISVRTCTDAEGRAVVEVQDSGCGIQPEHLACIFDPFFTTKPVGEGTGLGLALCHSIVTSLGGDIQVQSAPGQGALFRVVLPAAQEDAERVPEPSVAPALPAGPRARILVVDDEPLVAKSLVRLLGAEHQAEAVTSARAALARIGAGEHFDLVFCDVMMPEMSGRDFWEALGAAAPALQPRVVFVTGGAFTAEARRFLEQLPGRVVAKPFDPAEISAMVRERLGPRAA